MSISLDGITSVPDPQSVEYDTGERTKLGKDAFLKLPCSTNAKSRSSGASKQ